MAGYRTRGPIEISHNCYNLGVKIGNLKPADQCIICKKKLEFPNNLLLLHKAEGIQVYSICDSVDCWKELGKKMTKGMR